MRLLTVKGDDLAAIEAALQQLLADEQVASILMLLPSNNAFAATALDPMLLQAEQAGVWRYHAKVIHADQLQLHGAMLLGLRASPLSAS